jgi:hypothetical protein
VSQRRKQSAKIITIFICCVVLVVEPGGPGIQLCAIPHSEAVGYRYKPS